MRALKILGDFAGRNDCLDDEGEGRKLGAELHRRHAEGGGAVDCVTCRQSRLKLQYFRQRIKYLEGELK
jgi:hypothetical protein